MANSSKDKQKNIAKHIAIIMDGNGRWAISNSLAISKGHSKGVEIVRDIVEESVKQNIASLTLYAFSTENWSRPKSEIDAIKKLVVKAINDQVPDLKKQKVKLKFFGEIEDFGSKILTSVHFCGIAMFQDCSMVNAMEFTCLSLGVLESSKNCSSAKFKWSGAELK